MIKVTPMKQSNQSISLRTLSDAKSQQPALDTKLDGSSDPALRLSVQGKVNQFLTNSVKREREKISQRIRRSFNDQSVDKVLINKDQYQTLVEEISSQETKEQKMSIEKNKALLTQIK